MWATVQILAAPFSTQLLGTVSGKVVEDGPIPWAHLGDVGGVLVYCFWSSSTLAISEEE